MDVTEARNKGLCQVCGLRVNMPGRSLLCCEVCADSAMAEEKRDRDRRYRAYRRMG